jgi:alpha-L-fucosidase
LTYNPKTERLYIHVLAWPFKHLHLDGFAGRVEYAQLLQDASEIPFKASEPDAPQKKTLTLELPVKKPNAAIPVIEIYLKAE